ncbi:hypothetical protein EDC01DRAFT_377207 [Geopyxis carbonaria]|nr:hypothetical protein EDC01DRAFT_377207 [Geopyxis carbonaria]
MPSLATPLLTVPDEITLHILTHLDIPDLYTLTKTSRHLRTLATDPLLHAHRLHTARQSLSHSLLTRPPLTSLRAKHIYISPREATLRSLSRSLLICRLKRHLAARPPASALVERGVLPGAAVEDGVLVAWLQEQDDEWVDAGPPGGAGGRWPRVRELVKRYRAAVAGQRRPRDTRWGVGRRVRVDPPRAKVLGLRRFYERLSRGQAVPLEMVEV